MEIILATANLHKREEIARIFKGHTILLPMDLGVEFRFEENGKSYVENSLGKARALYELTQRPVLADDSGLSVPALHGEPGIYSARYGSQKGGRLLSDQQRNRYLLEKLSGIQDRHAFFVCAMVFMLEEYRFFIAQETLSGTIIVNPRGAGGFGYDPVFYLEEYGKTVAELDQEEKNRISHRGKAGQTLLGVIKDLEIQR